MSGQIGRDASPADCGNDGDDNVETWAGRSSALILKHLFTVLKCLSKKGVCVHKTAAHQSCRQSLELHNTADVARVIV